MAIRTGLLLQIAAIAALVVVTACGADSDGLNLHDCEENLQQSGGWDARELVIEHVEPRQCPVAIEYAGQKVRSGADIYDYGVSDAESASLDLYSSVWNPEGHAFALFTQAWGKNYTIGAVYTEYPAAKGTDL